MSPLIFKAGMLDSRRETTRASISIAMREMRFVQGKASDNLGL
jgi:hypothetical protein